MYRFMHMKTNVILLRVKFMLSLWSFLDAAPYQPTRDISERKKGKKKKKKNKQRKEKKRKSGLSFLPTASFPTARRLHDRSMTPLLSFEGEVLLRVQKYILYMMPYMDLFRGSHVSCLLRSTIYARALYESH
jgi:hypothetical protein